MQLQVLLAAGCCNCPTLDAWPTPCSDTHGLLLLLPYMDVWTTAHHMAIYVDCYPCMTAWPTPCDNTHGLLLQLPCIYAWPTPHGKMRGLLLLLVFTISPRITSTHAVNLKLSMWSVPSTAWPVSLACVVKTLNRSACRVYCLVY